MSSHPRSRKLSASLFAALLAFGALLLITTLTWAKPSGTIVVNPGQSIQAAIDAANPGDTIFINAGTYTESLMLNKAVSLTGVSSAMVIVNALPNQRVLAVSGAAINNSVIISGFTGANGNVTGGNTCPMYCGGGILITGTAQPQLQNLIIANNRAGYRGGGLYANGSLSISGVSFVSNTAQRGGGGAHIMGDAAISDSRFVSNTCTASSFECLGGGLMAGNTLIVNSSQFISNTVVAGSVWGLGGGAYAGRAVTVTNSVFEDNYCIGGSACTGGGLYAYTTLTAHDTLFKGNSATNGGGGVYVINSATLINDRLEDNHYDGLDCDGAVNATDVIVSGNHNNGLGANVVNLVRGHFENNSSIDVYAKTLTLTGTQFSGNAGRAVYLNNYGTPSASRIVNAVFTGYGIAVLMDSLTGSRVSILQTTVAVKDFSPATAIVANQGTVVISNTIVTSHTLGIQQASGSVQEDYNLFFGNTTNLTGTITGGTHDVFGDPNFANPALGNYHIISPSAAIDAGINAGVATDLDGIHRPVGAGFDIGAYESINFTSHVYLPLIHK